MYCYGCGQAVSEGLFGELTHDYQTHDAHVPFVENDCE
jgi:hypothetical protein